MRRSDKWRRVQAAVEGEAVDRTPFALWMHFPEIDQRPGALAAATVDAYRRYDMDYVKVMFRSSFGLEDWGCTFEGYDARIGARECTRYAISSAEDWTALSRPAPDRGALGEQLQVLGMIRDALHGEAPILATLFAPSMLAARLAGRELFLDHLREHPDAVHAGLRTISETVSDFGEACLGSGSDGIFYAIDLAAQPFEREYRPLGERYDRPVLASLHERSQLTMLHLHGEDLLFDEMAGWPAHALNWYDRGAGPSLIEARARTDICLAGGIDQDRTLMEGTPGKVAAQVRDAVAELDSRGLLLAPGCSVPITAPEENLAAASAVSARR